MQETQVLSLGWEDPLQKGMVIQKSILVCRISWIEESGGLQSMGSQRFWHNWVTDTHTNTCVFTVKGLPTNLYVSDEINTSENVLICANICIINIHDLFKNCLFFSPEPDFHIRYLIGSYVTS